MSEMRARSPGAAQADQKRHDRPMVGAGVMSRVGKPVGALRCRALGFGIGISG